MSVFWRVVVSVVSGIVFYAGLLFTVFRFAIPFLPITITKILVWNVVLFGSWGRGDPVGTMPNGQLIYDGSTGYLGFSVESICTGFLIYPVLIFIILTVWNTIKTHDN